MVLKKLSVLNYKNIPQVEIELSPKINCFFGNNGMGKTNLLDAIHYLSFCRSHINTPDMQIIRYDQPLCVVQGWYDYDGRMEEIFCAIRQQQVKQFRRNGKEYERLSEHIGLLPLVMVSPADIEVVKGGSSERRRFMDMIASQHDRSYLNTLIYYNKALLQRNMLLKNPHSDVALYEALEEQIGRYGKIVYDKRKSLIQEFVPVFNNYYQKIAGERNEETGLKYISHLETEELPDLLLKNRIRDRALGHTSCGIHKDELEMTLSGALIRRSGSQGQIKTYLIAMKLAQFVFLAGKGYTVPMLLLDDIFDKLDAERVEQIIETVNQNDFGQVFITDTNRKYLDRILSDNHYRRFLFKVEQGEVEKIDQEG